MFYYPFDAIYSMSELGELGTELARLRAAAGLTQRELAARAGVGLSTLARFEAGLASEFGLRKLLAALAVVGGDIRLVPKGQRRTLDDVLAERAGRR